MAVPKAGGKALWSVSDNRAENSQVNLVPWPLLRLELATCLIRGAPAICLLYLVQGYWHTALSPVIQELLTIEMPSRLAAHARVTQGMLNSIGVSLWTISEVLEGLQAVSMVRIDDLIIWVCR